MKKKIAITLLATLLLVYIFTSCGVSSSGNGTTDGIDYNEYISSTGRFIYTESAYLFFNDNQLTFLEPTLSAPISVMCSKLNCSHNNSDCPSYVESSGVYLWNNNLYYLQKDEKTYAIGLYRMDINGKNRILVRTLDIDPEKGYFYTYNIGGGYLILNFKEISFSGNINTLYLYSLQDPDAEPIEIFSNREKIKEVTTEDDNSDNGSGVTFNLGSTPGIPAIVLTYQRGGWIFYEVSLDGNRSLYGYEIATGENILITEDWNGGAVSVAEDTLYWYTPGNPLSATQLSTGETTEYMGDLPSDKSWWASCDNLYFYVTPDEDTFVKGGTALRIYDYEGREIVALEAEQQLSYAFSTSDLVFFYDLYSGTCLPVCYLEKSAIADGTAEFISLE